ncbi:transmembrane protein 208 [Tachypleus tridentatus]|uniref:transmembrane protein 208 n=1 Tax=Tachypleus tridentatus TaxID=6853 RepID=UPI003FD2D053
MPPQKGKQATKGQKQIVQENKETLKFYAIMTITTEVLYSIVLILFFWEEFSFYYWMVIGLTLAVYIGNLQFMNYMAKAVYSESGALLDGGIDLNMESGLAEHLKDLIILTVGVQLLSLLSNYFWFLWLLAPGRAFYLLWVNILGPWIFQPPPEVDEKKQKKLERKAKRH